ncbi:hypothetical protein PANDA_009585 [Ailuropoda melanoleuca]|uniref:Uncharacterized protein n=1 Tax=Ailuropoda melanoleuca TaxID=9646 RepID=D2HFC9_AILME|nr:hypothetical protein PANDA_009585 [Ailuropoda melanoleuca]
MPLGLPGRAQPLSHQRQLLLSGGGQWDLEDSNGTITKTQGLHTGPDGFLQGQSQKLLEPSTLKEQMEKLILPDRERLAQRLSTANGTTGTAEQSTLASHAHRGWTSASAQCGHSLFLVLLVFILNFPGLRTFSMLASALLLGILVLIFQQLSKAGCYDVKLLCENPVVLRQAAEQVKRVQVLPLENKMQSHTQFPLILRGRMFDITTLDIALGYLKFGATTQASITLNLSNCR